MMKSKYVLIISILTTLLVTFALIDNYINEWGFMFQTICWLCVVGAYNWYREDEIALSTKETNEVKK